MNLYFQQPLPCIHVWEFIIEEEGCYFVCANCHARFEYDRSEIADYEPSELEEV